MQNINEIANQKNRQVIDKMIGCLCWFNDSKYYPKRLGILKSVFNENSDKIIYISDTGYGYKYCEPVKPEEIKFHNNISNVNKINELISIFKNICISSWTNDKDNYSTYDKEHAELKWTEIQLFFIKALEEWNIKNV